MVYNNIDTLLSFIAKSTRFRTMVYINIRDYGFITRVTMVVVISIVCGQPRLP